jgi:hypothetical protein
MKGVHEFSLKQARPLTFMLLDVLVCYGGQARPIDYEVNNLPVKVGTLAKLFTVLRRNGMVESWPCSHAPAPIYVLTERGRIAYAIMAGKAARRRVLKRAA